MTGGRVGVGSAGIAPGDGEGDGFWCVGEAVAPGAGVAVLFGVGSSVNVGLGVGELVSVAPFGAVGLTGVQLAVGVAEGVKAAVGPSCTAVGVGVGESAGVAVRVGGGTGVSPPAPGTLTWPPKTEKGSCTPSRSTIIT